MTKEISISQFKAHCLEIINNLQNNAESVVITKRHKPVAKMESFQKLSKTSIFGIFKDKAEIKEDIVVSLNENWSSEQ